MTGKTFQASGISRWYALTTAPASLTAPKATEINAGVELTCDIREYTGFATEQSFIDDPSGCTKLVGKVAGQKTLQDSSLTLKLYEGDASDNPLMATLAEDEELWVVHAFAGATGAETGDLKAVAAGDLVNVWHAQVGGHSVSTPYSNDLASWMAPFGVFSGATEAVVAT